MQPASPPPNDKKGYTWPIAVNLGLLVLAAALSQADPDVLGIVVLGLVVINSLAAGILSFAGRLPYVVAFLLAALVVGLVGLGVCALLVSNIHGGH